MMLPMTKFSQIDGRREGAYDTRSWHSWRWGWWWCRLVFQFNPFSTSDSPSSRFSDMQDGEHAKEQHTGAARETSQTTGTPKELLMVLPIRASRWSSGYFWRKKGRGLRHVLWLVKTIFMTIWVVLRKSNPGDFRALFLLLLSSLACKWWVHQQTSNAGKTSPDNRMMQSMLMLPMMLGWKRWWQLTFNNYWSW